MFGFRRRPRPTPVHLVPNDLDGDLGTVYAPASIPLPVTPIPTVCELEDDVDRRVAELGASLDEYTGHVLDRHYAQQLAECQHTVDTLTEHALRVDRRLIAEAHDAHRDAATAAQVAAQRADQARRHADDLWTTALGELPDRTETREAGIPVADPFVYDEPDLKFD
ncbi:hypothetical protein [Dietzia sp. SYD-A1]|uniref:hypothetical protein n=1 Tax=Dietzia sp. SYD-A1 TaxID=2780141 RepID=UPI001891AB41|nr:hypothetical protein [Dietzia sp. SYD-A1]